MSPCRQFPIKDDGFFVSEGRAVTPFPTALFEPFPTPTFRENRRHGDARTRRRGWDEYPTRYAFRDVPLLHHCRPSAILTAHRARLRQRRECLPRAVLASFLPQRC